MVQVDDLCRRFPSGDDTVQVISGLSFRVPAGESMAVVGRSGSGKSTLLNMLCGLQMPDAGVISVAGKRFDISGAAKELSSQWAALRQQAIGVVFQDANLMPAMTLLENVQLRASLAGRNVGESMDWLATLDVAEEAHRYPDQVSGGQRQRAALAMVFAMHPAVILADEPTGSLDLHTAADVADRLFEVQRDTGCTLLLATHDTALADRCHQRLDLGGR
jgi:putative ABC transport system ATP-binding protein